MFSSELTPKAEQTRARIRAAAIASFIERGYPDTTIRLIAREAGVSVGNAYYYFDGKEVTTVNVSMQDDMYIMLDLWFGSASGTPDGSTPQGKDNSYEVNYVRAWKFK